MIADDERSLYDLRLSEIGHDEILTMERHYRKKARAGVPKHHFPLFMLLRCDTFGCLGEMLQHRRFCAMLEQSKSIVGRDGNKRQYS